METVWTDRDELDRITNVFEDEYHKISETINKIKETVPEYNIGNIGLYSGNKMRSMYRRYKENGVKYSNSKVNRTLETYFMMQFVHAAYMLKIFGYKLRNSFTPYTEASEKRRFILNSRELAEYKRLCDVVYNFDLDKDACNAINEILDDSLIFAADMNLRIDEYNSELKQLGVKQSIAHRQEELDYELDEQELLALKYILDNINEQMNNGEQKKQVVVKVKKSKKIK